MGVPAGDARLNIDEAVLLGHALVARVADSRGIRAFFIKGPASVAQGLRPPKTSVDVDVFVAPADLEFLLAGLHQRGWRKRTADEDERVFPTHSATLNHPFWPCHIDIHFRFPGMERDPADAFQAMWAHTEFLELAGQGVRVPSKALGIVILALHALRAPHLQVSQRELSFLRDLSAREALGPTVLEISAATDALAAMRPFLEELVPGPAMVDWPSASTEWRNRLISKEPGSARIIGILQAPLRDKPRMLRTALLPPDTVYLSKDPYADLSQRGRLRAYGSRWARFLRASPRLAQDLATYWKDRNTRP
ncbi:nucleotidyltransferase family protein [Arthrobacter sp. ZGTC131]|uniref:nucleotidyltransferase family protein n=1 Tax=Arthrobacter sp. ZGTC131 TaxID=2058898 RepID=UPI000CE4345E|nr:nucleotidyltransferase family protein [Arthrobacter sp. ZGTC131]